MIWAAISWCSAGPILTVNFRITASDYVDILVNQVHPMIQLLFPKNDTILQDKIRSYPQPEVFCWFEEHEDPLQHLPCPAQSPDLDIIEPLWSVLECRVRSRFPPPSSLKQLKDILHEESGTVLRKILLRTYMSLFQEGRKLHYRQMVAQLRINKEMCINHNCFHYFVCLLYRSFFATAFTSTEISANP